MFTILRTLTRREDMALFLVSRTDDVGYDEHDAIVVRAGNEATALKIAMHGIEEEYGGRQYVNRFSGFAADGSNLEVERLEARGPAELVLASFNAG